MAYREGPPKDITDDLEMTDKDLRTVLYVEDDPDYREAVSAVVKAGGYRVVLASSGEEGLRLYQQEDPDVILLDLMMEEVDSGMNFVKELRASGAGKPVVLLTSMGNALRDSKDLSELGISAVLQKPVRGETLLALLRSRIG